MHDTLSEVGARQNLIALEGVAAGRLVTQPQPQQGVTYAAKLDKRESRIDWTRPARDIDRQIRAFNPWPAAETTLDGQAVKLWRSRLAPAGGNARSERANEGDMADEVVKPGTLLGLNGDALQVQCGEGVLQVLELQRAGRKALPARDFINALPVGGAPSAFQ